MLKKIILILSLLTVGLFSKNPVTDIILSKAVFEEKIVWENPGRQVRKMIPAKKVKKGAILVYVNQIFNKSAVSKKEIVVDNPIPYGSAYIRGTSNCEGVCSMLYSIDGGKTFKESQDLYVIYGTKKRLAKGSEYTHIKFIFPKLLPYAKIRMAFKARVK